MSLVPDTLLSMTWRDVFFAHWPVEPGLVAETLPAGLAVDTDDQGRAWLSVVGFVMEDIGPPLVPGGLSFPELNLRTYVRHETGPGIYFYNLDADDWLGVPVARRLFRLPYYRATMDVTEREGSVRFQSKRTQAGVPPARFDATIEPRDDPVVVSDYPAEDVPAAFLVERYRFYASDEDGRLYHGDVDHEPWRLQPADIDLRRNDLFAAAGFDVPDGEPVTQYSPSLAVTAGALARLEHSL